MTNLNEKVAIVTGASSGIGEAVARELRRAGMRLVLAARREPALRKLADELGECAIVAGDVADPAVPQKLVDAALSRFGRLDVVFNNAGVMIVGGVRELDLDAACAMVRTNVEAVYRLGILALRHMLDQKSGHLVNVSSTLGLKVRPTTGCYAGTKFAVEAFSEDLRMQCAGTGVRVSVIEPGLTATHLQDHFAQHPSEAMGIGRMVAPEDIARAVRFVLEQPAHVTIPKLLMQPAEQAM